jgi:hypothetical protein
MKAFSARFSFTKLSSSILLQLNEKRFEGVFFLGLDKE